MVLIGFITVLYVLFTISVFTGLILYREPKSDNDISKKIDILVPFKNEAPNLPRLLSSLLNQTYSAHNMEIYLINDHSSDNGEEIIAQYQKNHSNLHLLQNSGSGKKEALITGFKASENEIILMTDADTLVPENWVMSHSTKFTADTDMMIGSVNMNPVKRSFWHLLQVLEYKSIIAVTNGMAALKIPVMCSAANLSFRRSSLDNIREALNMNYSSGDDMFLLQYFRKHKKKIILNASATKIKSETFKKFIRQRIRWSGKAEGYSDIMTIITGTVVILMNLSVLFSAIAIGFNKAWIDVFLMLFFTKLVVDIITIAPTIKKNEISLLLFIFPLSFIYPVYTIFVTAAGLLTPKNKQSW